MKTLDPTWWRKGPGGYLQANALLTRLKTRAKVTGWALYIDGMYRGSWPTLRLAKRRAAEITTTSDRTPGYSNFGGGGPFASMGSPSKKTP